MKPKELLSKLDAILDSTRAAILVTTDDKGRPHTRWMAPVILKHRPGFIFTFSAPGTSKLDHIDANPDVEWMIQTRDLREVVNIRGIAHIIDNPALKSELLEILGPRLLAFWRANADAEQFVVIETAIHEAT